MMAQNNCGKKIKQRNNGLQILRSIACFLIFLSHYNAFHHFTTKFDAGAFGVEIFIILSGFLKVLYNSAENLEKKSIRKIFHTLIRKFRKFYPLHLFTLFAAIPFELEMLKNGESSIKHLICALFLNILCLQSFIPRGSFYFSLNAVSWYLTLVLIFLLLGDWFVFIINKVSKKIKIPWILCILILLEILWTSCFQFSNIKHWLIYINPLARCLDFCIGIVIGYIYKNLNYNTKFIKFSFFASLISTIFSLFICRLIIGTKFEAWSYTVCFIPASLFLVFFFALIGDKEEISKKNLIVLFGNVTMEFFLIHQIICRYICKVLTNYSLFEAVTNNRFLGLCVTLAGGGGTLLLIFIWRKAYNIILGDNQ